VGSTLFSVDRPRFFAICISAVTGQVVQLNDIEQLQTQKAEDGSSGSWSFTCPLVQEYSIASRSTTRVNPYAATVGPMDLVALYGWRSTDSNNASGGQAQTDPVSALGPAAFGALHYPTNDTTPDGTVPAVVTSLGTATCLMIGMVDSSRVSKGYGGSRASFTVSGRDLTKIFEINNTTIPDSSLAAREGAVGDSGLFGFGALPLSQANSGPVFLVAALDILVGKNLAALGALIPATVPGGKSTPVFTPPNKAVTADYLVYGYPWRNFVRLDALDKTYKHLTAQNYPPYTAQMGGVWSSILEVANVPLSRIFVTELGQLIFDDSLSAWTSQASVRTIAGEDVRDFDSGFDDAALVTFLSILPTRAPGVGTNQALIAGGFLPGTGFVNGLAAAKGASEAQVATFGYRYGQFPSYYDITYADALKRQGVLLESMNELFTATLTLKGNSYYRVGSRVQVMEDTGRAHTTNATWYVASVTHECQFGNDWTTVLSLKYPMTT
jgi:hypothetical protein